MSYLSTLGLSSDWKCWNTWEGNQKKGNAWNNWWEWQAQEFPSMTRGMRRRDLVLGDFCCLGYHPEIHDPRYMDVGSFPLDTMWKVQPHTPSFPGRWVEDSCCHWEVFIDQMVFFLHPRRWRCCSPKALKLSTTRIGDCRGPDGIGGSIRLYQKAWKYENKPSLI